MSREIRHTGGSKEFHYNSEDIERIESEDTDSTREFKESLRKWRGSVKYKILKFFRNNSPRTYYNYRPLLKNFFILMILGILMAIVYANLEKLNDIALIFIRLGSTLMLVGLFFFLKYVFRTYKNIKYFVQIQRSLIKWSLAILFLILLLFAYQNKNDLFDPIVNVYEKTDFGIFYPFTFSLDDIKENLPESSPTYENVASNNDESDKGFFEEIFESEPLDIDLIESEVLKLVNAERSKYNARALNSRNDLHNFARSWSEKMISQNFFEHSNMGFSFNSYAGENIMQTPIHSSVIGCGSTYDEKDMASCIVDGWIGSPGHHENMINPQFSLTGVGVACDSSECKSTQVFVG